MVKNTEITEIEEVTEKTFHLKTDNTTKGKIQDLVKKIQLKEKGNNADKIILSALGEFDITHIFEETKKVKDVKSELLEVKIKKLKKTIETQYTCKTDKATRGNIQKEIKAIKKKINVSFNINLNSDYIVMQSLKLYLKKERENE